jgi:alkaline phosphatase D
MSVLLVFSLFLFQLASAYYLPLGNHTNMTLSNFSFGSCFGGFLATKKTWIFKIISKHDPQLWVWGGDAAYLDSFTINYFKRSLQLNFTHSEIMFNKTKFDDYYKPFHSKVPTIGVWDDHDYGFNDGNKYYKDKEYIKNLFLDFIDEPRDSIRRSLNRGIYTSYTFGDQETHKTVKIILLDVRFDKNSLVFDKYPDVLGMLYLM